MKRLSVLAVLFCCLFLNVSVSTADSDYEKGVAALEAGQLEEGFQLIKRAAEAGNIEAQSDLGIMYLKGQGVEPSLAEAVNWFEVVANAGSVWHQNELAQIYEWIASHQEKQDLADAWYEDALAWYRVAAEQEYGLAQYNIGRMFYEGLGVEQDNQEAFAWVWLAKQNPDAQDDVSELYDALKNMLSEDSLSRAESRGIEIQARITSGVDTTRLSRQEKEMIRYSDGGFYVGNVSGGEPHGKVGSYTFPDDRFIVGSFQEGQPWIAVEFDGNADVIATYWEGVKTEGGPDSQIATGKWTPADFVAAALADEGLIEINLSGENLSGRSFSWRNMTRADLSGTDLNGAKLVATNLVRANLSSANLSYADLRGIKAATADLRGANLRHADATGALLGSANLMGADLSHANLSDSDLNDAQMRAAILTDTIFCNTTMPDGTINHSGC